MNIVPGAVVVLFHPSEAQVSNLIRLKQLVEHIVAVDNSPVLDTQLHHRVQSEGIDIVANFNKGGVAGAYNAGFERLIERGCELLFILDQDSQVEGGYFAQMTEACRTLNGSHFLIGPKVFDVNVNRYLPAHIVRRFSVKPVPITNQKRGLLPCSSIITSGSMISAATYRAVGRFREDYFIDHVDTEYCFRARSKGVPIYINTSAVLKHEIGKRTDHRFLFFKLIQWNTHPVRQYYSARNCIHIVRRYGRQFPLLILINIITAQQFLSITFYEKDKRKKIVAMTAGIIDGLRGRRGSIESCRPRTFVFCTKSGG